MITVCIPYYSGLAYLRRALDSVVAQSCDQWRAIVCDDRGPEDAAELVGSYGPRIRYVRNEQNLGMIGNWNRCLDLAETDLVSLLHADDELLPDYVAHMLAAASRHPAACAIYCKTRIIGPASKPVFSLADFAKRFVEPAGRNDLVLRGEESVRALARGNFIMCPTLCYRRSRLETRRFSGRWRFVQDLEFTTRLLREGETIVGLPQVAYAYRRHSENATSRFTRNLLRFEEERTFLNELALEATKLGWQRAAQAARRKTVVKLHLLYYLLGDVVFLRPAAAAAKARLLATM
jgi:glycosyltransferase involved in cell wall biosynthesis